MKLSPEWRRVWRRFSFNALGWAAAGIGAWQSGAVPQEFKDYIGTPLAVWALMGLLVLGMVGSVIDQPGTRTPQKGNEP